MNPLIGGGKGALSLNHTVVRGPPERKDEKRDQPWPFRRSECRKNQHGSGRERSPIHVAKVYKARTNKSREISPAHEKRALPRGPPRAAPRPFSKTCGMPCALEKKEGHGEKRPKSVLIFYQRIRIQGEPCLRRKGTGSG